MATSCLTLLNTGVIGIIPIVNVHFLNSESLAFYPCPKTSGNTCLIEPLPHLPPCKRGGYQGQQKAGETRRRLLRWGYHTRRVWALVGRQRSSAFTPPPMTSTPSSPTYLPYSQYSSAWSREEGGFSALLLKSCVLLDKYLPPLDCQQQIASAVPLGLLAGLSPTGYAVCNDMPVPYSEASLLPSS